MHTKPNLHLQKKVSSRGCAFTMMTSSNGKTFSALLAIYAGNSPVTDEFPAQGPVTRSFDVFFDLRLNKRLSKQSWGWWFETLSRSLWRHCNATRDSSNITSHGAVVIHPNRRMELIYSKRPESEERSKDSTEAAQNAHRAINPRNESCTTRSHSKKNGEGRAESEGEYFLIHIRTIV